MPPHAFSLPMNRLTDKLSWLFSAMTFRCYHCTSAAEDPSPGPILSLPAASRLLFRLDVYCATLLVIDEAHSNAHVTKRETSSRSINFNSTKRLIHSLMPPRPSSRGPTTSQTSDV